MLTDNQKKVLRTLFTSLDSDNSINYLAKICNLSPNGIYKILTNFEKEEILKAKTIANIKSYKINFESERTIPTLELMLITKLENRLKYRYEELKELKNICQICIIFGSYTNLRKNPNDIDILFILDRKSFRKYTKRLINLQDITPIKIHDVVQTKQDLILNIKRKDKVILEIIKTGIVLWGQRELIEIMKNVYQ